MVQADTVGLGDLRQRITLLDNIIAMISMSMISMSMIPVSMMSMIPVFMMTVMAFVNRLTIDLRNAQLLAIVDVIRVGNMICTCKCIIVNPVILGNPRERLAFLHHMIPCTAVGRTVCLWNTKLLMHIDVAIM